MAFILDNYAKNFMPSVESAKKHIELTIKYYGQVSDDVLKKQLELAHRTLYVSGFSNEQATRIINECVESEKHVL